MMKHMIRHTRSVKSMLSALGLVIGLGVALSAAPTKAQDLAFPDSGSTEQMLADQLMAMAQSSYGRTQAPRPDQIERTRILLDMATDLAPDDVGLWEFRISMAAGIEDQQMLIDSLRNYLRLAPDDDAAQLQLIQARLSSIESIDEYLAALERMLRSEGAVQLSAPLRSRLSTIAAQVAQEIGDERRAGAWLGYAIKLDPANPDAAAMMYQLTLDREGSPRQQGAALVGMLKASPVDPTVRAALANLLMQEGVYGQALDQFDVAMELVDIQSRFELLTQYALCLIAAGRGDEVQPLLLELQLFMKQLADAQNPDLVVDEDAEPEPPSLDDLPPLPPTLEFARLILLYETNPVAAEESFKRLQESSGATEDLEQRQNLIKQLIWIAAVFNQDPAWVKHRVSLLEDQDEVGRLAVGWLALREGEHDSARRIFEALGGEDMFARLGLASMPGLDDEQRATLYQQMIWDNPGSMASVVAAHRLHQMGKTIVPTSQGIPLRVLVDDIPRQLWTPALTVSPWVRLSLRVSPGSFGYLQPMIGEVTLMNATRFPLSVGPNSAVQPLLMVSNLPSLRNEPMGQLQPTFFHLGRRLTLQPGERIQAEIRLDRFDLGQLTALYPTEPISFSTTAILDPRPMPNGAVVPGPLGALRNAGSLLARGTPATPSNLQLWIKDVDATDDATRALAIARLLVVARQPAESTEALDLRARVSDTIGQRYPSFNRLLKAWTVRFMLPDEEGNPVSQRVIDLAGRSDDPLVRIVYLVMKADSATSPALTDAIRHDDPTIRAFATAMKTGFEEDAKLLAEQQGEADTQTDPLIADPLEGLFGPSETPPPTQQPGADDDAPWLP